MRSTTLCRSDPERMILADWARGSAIRTPFPASRDRSLKDVDARHPDDRGQRADATLPAPATLARVTWPTWKVGNFHWSPTTHRRPTFDKSTQSPYRHAA